MRRYTEQQRREVIQRARDTLARLAVADCVDALRAEREELQREMAHDREFRQLQLKRKQWLADHERRQHGRNDIVYKVKWNARLP
jgi:hypothetical protein